MTACLAAIATVLWIAATPPQWFPGAGLLIVAALAAFYHLVVGARRAAPVAYCLGVVHMAAFSWSLHHVVSWAVVAIALVGGLYYALVVPWTRALKRWLPGPWAFAIAVAGCQWLRGHVPEIPYPHGQPIHCWYPWPRLLGWVAWGGEVLGNALLAATGAGLVEVWRSFPRPRVSTRQWAAALGIASLAVVWPPRHAKASDAPVRIVAIQPNLRANFQGNQDFDRLVSERLVQPTLDHCKQGDAPELIVWPENVYPFGLDARDSLPQRLDPVWHVPLLAGTRLLVGTLGAFPGERVTPVAVLLDHRGGLLGFQCKRRLVPAGEFVPFLRWLPAALHEALLVDIEQRMGARPDLTPGMEARVLETTAGVRFGALLCYDNAFPEIAAELVALGARLLIVLSNESWYRGGGEIEQMEAMTVCRAVELATPVVRATIDGSSLAVDAAGVILARLPLGDGRETTRVLTVAVPPGAGALPPMLWLHTALGWIVPGSLLIVVWHAVQSWARLRRERSAGSILGQRVHGSP